MESFFSRYKNALVLIIVLMAQIVGLAVQVRRPVSDLPDAPPVRLIRYWVVSLIAPPERILHLGGSGIRGIWSGYINLTHVQQQNRDLQVELNRLRLEQGSLLEDVRQARRLQAMLNFRQKFIYKTLPAQVIGTSGSDQSRVLLIDKGFSDGIRANMAVITPDGIVGKVRDVFPGTSQVLEISDQASGAGVILANTRIRGILRGNAGGQPQIINISPDDRIKAGEPIVTTGGDRIFPRGLPVGTVDGVVHDPDSTFVSIAVAPGANLARLEEVLVITATADQTPPQAQQDLADSASVAASQRAADVLSQRLPSRVDPNAPPPPAPDPLHPAPPVNPNAIPVPVKAVPPLHPDKYSPGSVPPATSLTPGARVADAPASAPQPAAPVRSSQPPATGVQPANPSVIRKPVSPGTGAVPTTPKPVAKPPVPPTGAGPASTRPLGSGPVTPRPVAKLPATASGAASAVSGSQSELPGTNPATAKLAGKTPSSTTGTVPATTRPVTKPPVAGPAATGPAKAPGPTRSTAPVQGQPSVRPLTQPSVAPKTVAPKNAPAGPNHAPTASRPSQPVPPPPQGVR
jgi:rod shape-determining protein MreC